MLPNFSFACGNKQRGNTVKSVTNTNNVHIFDLWKDAELSTGKLSENNSDIGSKVITF
jgi:hypothetical protein